MKKQGEIFMTLKLAIEDKIEQDSLLENAGGVAEK